jgi:DNA-binding winged helix-turn-helix (wHTH) protein
LVVSIRFRPFVLNPQTRQLLRDSAEIHLPTKAFDLLCALIRRRPEVVPKAELLSLVWPEAFVVDANLNVLIGEIRRALDDDPRHPQYIRTVSAAARGGCERAVLDRMEGAHVCAL